jgi:hypothetical protein
LPPLFLLFRSRRTYARIGTWRRGRIWLGAHSQSVSYLLSHAGIQVGALGQRQRSLRFFPSNTSEGPGGMPSHQWLLIVESRNQGWYRHRVADIAEGYTHISQQSPALGPLDWTLLKAPTELIFVQGKQW